MWFFIHKHIPGYKGAGVGSGDLGVPLAYHVFIHFLDGGVGALAGLDDREVVEMGVCGEEDMLEVLIRFP